MKLHKNIFLGLFTFLALLTAGFTTASAANASSNDNQSASYSSLYRVAKSNLGKPYVWGATGPSGFDCSGFTSYVYKKGAGISLTRTSQSQYTYNNHISYNKLKKGDLVFFGSNASSISHVGFYTGKGKMIDAQNRGVVSEKVIAPWWNFVGGSRPAAVK